MADTKKKKPVKKAPKKSAVKKKPVTKSRPANRGAASSWADPSYRGNRIMPILLIVIALLIFVFILPWSQKGFFGPFIGNFFTGLFSFLAYLIPLLLLFIAIKWKSGIESASNLRRILLSVAILFTLPTLWSLFVFTFNPDKATDIAGAFSLGASSHSGGLVGTVIATGLKSAIGNAASTVIVFALALVEIVSLLDIRPIDMIKDYIERRREWKEEEAEAEEEAIKEYKKQKALERAKEKATRRAEKQDTASEEGNSSGLVDDDYFVNDPPKERKKSKSASDTAEIKETDGDDLSSIFANPEDIAILDKFKGRTGVDDLPVETIDSEIGLFEGTEEAKKFEKAKKMTEGEMAAATAAAEHEILEKAEDEKEDERPYVFPSYDLLTPDKNKKNQDVSEELRENAKKLVDTLRSFKVNTRVANISRGPTITRYELTPDEGVRVHKIADLVDDISLALATTGVRIEAPIPGKSAVGVEVPNSEKSIVYLRPLLERSEFKDAKSDLTVALGTDIAGKPMYADLAKLPHLIIAGATGMGKSVCINSMLISLLYKSAPSEVKLILIDPKRVELAMYNGLPHLLMPVVTDPKKAAGTLNWAVSEMENRFEIFGSVGMRDIKNYNELAKESDDEELQPLPRIVIVIDELADLMMTAKKDVETSICRLAQKARAAGIHVVIGTQRPSVDVITGLIKANFPSRMAFTVASQFDSRTILDIAGAEKLIGNGDMLYAPVGSPKPMRVQGAFVDGKEVEAVVEFIKSTSSAHYDKNAIEEVERKSAGVDSAPSGGGNIGGGSSDKDPMLLHAIELAIEAKKVSTSMLQRKLSIGYGRAAKLIDIMEEMGVVSPQVGMKPRNVLITEEQYQEMVLGKPSDPEF